MWEMQFTFIILDLIEIKANIDQEEYQKQSTEYYWILLGNRFKVTNSAPFVPEFFAPGISIVV